MIFANSQLLNAHFSVINQIIGRNQYWDKEHPGTTVSRADVLFNQINILVGVETKWSKVYKKKQNVDF